MTTDLVELPECTPEEEIFAACFVKWHGNATRAFREIKPGVTYRSAMQGGYLMTRRPQVAAKVAALYQDARERAREYVPRIIERAREIIEADPSELTQMRRHACRYCWGEGHRYQFTTREYERKWVEWAYELDAALAARKPPPAAFEDGGTGYSVRRAPNAECPECGGHGHTRVILADTRDLSPGAAALFQGVERTKNGFKVNMHDQRAWAENILKVAGAFIERRELSGPNGGPIPNANLNANVEATPADIARAYADLVKGR